MAEFKKEGLDAFLGIVRKYMQIRGALSQKDLAEKTETGVSTMSRFLTKKTHDLDHVLISKIVAKLDIPLVEIIDFVDESFWEKFKRMVEFYKSESSSSSGGSGGQIPGAGPISTEDGAGDLEEALIKTLGTAQKNVQANVEVGGRPQTITFSADQEKKSKFLEQIAGLSPRQKAYMSDFLNLDSEGRDLMVDLGNSLFRYFRQKGVEF